MTNKAMLFNGKTIDLNSDEGWDILGGGDDGKKADLQKMFRAVPWLFRGVHLRADAVASMPFRITRKGGKTEVDSSTEYKNIVTFFPNPRRLFWLTEAALTLEGRSYLYKNPNAAGKIAELRYWSPTTISLDQTKLKTGEIVFKRGSLREEYTPKKVAYLWGFDPYTENGPGNSSPGVASMAASGVINSVDEFARLFAERGFVRAFIMTQKGLTDGTERQRIEDWFNNFMRGVRNAFRWKVFNADTTNITEVGDGFKEIESSNITNSRREDISAALGIPMSLLFSGSANGLGGGGVASQGDVDFYSKTVVPQCTFIQEGWNEQIFEPAGYHLEFLPETLDIFQEDEAQRTTAWNTFMDALLKCPTEDLCIVSLTKLGFELDDEWKSAITSYYQKKEQDAAKTQERLQAKEQTPPGQVKPADAPPANEGDTPIKSDLRRWKTKALKALERGNGAGVAFVSDCIPEDMTAQINESLGTCSRADEVKAVFDQAMTDTPSPIAMLAFEVRRAVTLLEREMAT